MNNLYVLRDADGRYFCPPSVHPLSRTESVGLATSFVNLRVAEYLAQCKQMKVYELIPTAVSPETS